MNPNLNSGRPKLGEILVNARIVSEAQVHSAIQLQSGAKVHGGRPIRIGEALEELRCASPVDVARALAIQFGVRYMDPSQINPAALNLLPMDLVKKYLVLPVSEKGKRLTVLIHDPIDIEVIDNLRFRLNREIDFVVGARRLIKEFIDHMLNGASSPYHRPGASTNEPDFMGLSTFDPWAKIALRGVRVTSRMLGLFQHTLVEQTFVNLEKDPIEAVYTFPLPDGAAICGFQILTGDRVLTGVIEEANNAVANFAKAVKEGHGAYMIDQQRPDVFTSRVGNLKPGQAVTIRLTYVAELTANERTLRLDFPTTIAPRFMSDAGTTALDAMIDAENLNPPHVLDVPYGLTFRLELDLGMEVHSVTSPTHPVDIDSDGAGRLTTVSLAREFTPMDRNVVIEIKLKKENAAGVRAERLGQEVFVAATFVPEVGEFELPEPKPTEVVFLVDCSSSMFGSSIDQARRALSLCLRTLNLGDRFNICCFGDKMVSMRPDSVEYNQRTLASALDYIARIDAKLGGTQLHDPLKQLLTMNSPRGMNRSLVLLTDGQVTNEPAIIELASQSRGTRIFSFGIGPAASAYLVNGLAKATGGAAEFIAPGERIEEKVLRQFGRMASPMITHIRIDALDSSERTMPSDIVNPSTTLFDGDAATCYARFQSEAPAHIVLSCLVDNVPRKWTLPVDPPTDAKPIIAPIWALKRMGVDPVSKILLSLMYQVLCDKTTFIAIEHRSPQEQTNGEPELRRVPVMLAAGWGDVAKTLGLQVGNPGINKTMSIDKTMKELSIDRSSRSIDVKGCTFESGMDFLAEDVGSGSGTPDLTRESVDDSSTPKRKAKPTSPPNPFQVLSKLLSTQSAEGCFEESALLKSNTINGKPYSYEALRKELSAMGENDPQVIATAMTLAAMHQCFPAQSATWKRAADKARRWLKQKGRTTVLQWITSLNSVVAGG